MAGVLYGHSLAFSDSSYSWLNNVVGGLQHIGLQDLVVVSPDAGRVKLNKKFASKVGAELAILDKERPAKQVAEIGYVIADILGNTAVRCDDIIDTTSQLKARVQTPLHTDPSRL